MKERLVRFGHLILTRRFLKDCQQYDSSQFLKRNLQRLKPDEIRQGLNQRDGSLLLQQACTIAGINYEDLTRDIA